MSILKIDIKWLFIVLFALFLCYYISPANSKNCTIQNNITPDTTICSNNFFLPGEGSKANRIGFWKILNNTSSQFLPDSSNYNAEVVNLQAGINTLIWVQTDTTYGQSNDTIVIFNNSLQTAINSLIPGVKDEICENELIVSAIISDGETVLWSSFPFALIENPGSPETRVSNLAEGLTIFNLLVTKGNCTVTLTDSVYNYSPSPAIAGNDTVVCRNTVQLNAGIPYQGTGTWNIVNNNLTGIPVIDNINSPSAVLTNLNPGKNLLVWTVTTKCNNPVRDTVEITYAATSPALILSPPYDNQETCFDSITLFASNPVFGQGKWSKQKDKTSVLETLSPNSVRITHLSEGNNVLFWEVQNQNCPPSTDTIIIRNKKPSPALVFNPLDTHTCVENVRLIARRPSQGLGKWYKVIKERSAFKEEEISSDSSYTFHGLSPDTNIFRWAVSWGGCQRSVKEIFVINDLPVLHDAGSNISICSDSITLNAKNPNSNYKGIWEFNDNSDIQISSFNNPQAKVNYLSKGDNVFIWKITHATNKQCRPVRDTVVISNNMPFTASIPKQPPVCSDSAIISANIPLIGRGRWSSTNQNISFTSRDSVNTWVKGLIATQNSFVWTVTNKGCQSRDTLKIYNNKPSEFTAGADIRSCKLDNILDGKDVTPVFPEATGVWTIISQPTENNNEAILSNRFLPKAIADNLNSVGDYYFEWAVTTAPNCITRDTVKISKKEFTEATKPEDKAVCANEIILKTTEIIDGKGEWRVISGRGTFADKNNNETKVTNLGENANRFHWVVTNGSCEDIAAFTVTRYDSSTVAVIENQDLISLCDQDTILLRANVNNPLKKNESSFWYHNDTLISENSKEISFSGKMLYAPKKNVFKWKTQNGVCPAKSDSITIIKYQDMPKPVIEEKSRNTCNTDEKVAIIENFQSQNFTWKALTSDSANIISSTGTSNNTFIFSGLKVGSYVYKYEVNNGPCSNSDTLYLIVKSLPSEPELITRDQHVCATENINAFIVEAVPPDPGSEGRWKVDESFTSEYYPEILTPENQVAATVKLNIGQNRFLWETHKGGDCPRQQVLNIYVDREPFAANAGEDRTLHDASGSLKGEEPKVGFGVWSLIEGSVIISDPSRFNSEFTNLAPGKNVLEWKITNGNCPSTSDTLIMDRIEFEIPKGFSPNGDDLNQKFIIRGVDEYFPRELTIFNRWGKEVYHSIHYNNDWEGQNNEGTDLTDDTYYYVLKLRNERTINGFVLIKRK